MRLALTLLLGGTMAALFAPAQATRTSAVSENGPAVVSSALMDAEQAEKLLAGDLEQLSPSPAGAPALEPPQVTR